MKHLKSYEQKYNKDDFDRSIEEFKVGDFVICIDPYTPNKKIIEVKEFERVEVVEINEEEYGYVTIKNKHGEIGTYFKNRLMPEIEFYENKYNL